MRARGSRLSIAALLIVATASGLTARAPELADCDARTAAGTDPRASHCYLDIARSGRATFEQVAVHLVRLLAQRPEATHIQLALASVRSGQNHPDADTLFRAAGAAYARQGDALGEILTFTAAATHTMLRGRLDEAEAFLSRAAVAAERTNDPQLSARVHTTQAWLAYRQLDYGRGLRLLAGVKDTVAAGDADLRSTWLSAMGAILWALGRADESRENYQRQAELLRVQGNRYEEASARVNLILLGGSPDLRSDAYEAARVAREGGNLSAESAAYFYLSGLVPDKAREYSQRSVDLALASGRADQISRARRSLAVATARVDAPEGFRLIDQAIEDARRAGDPNEALRNRFVKATMRWQHGPRDAAIESSLELFDAIEALRHVQPEDDVRAQRFQQWRFGYFRLAGHLLAGHLRDNPADPLPDADRDLAFATIERMRARMMLDRLDAARATANDEPDALDQERARLAGEVAGINRRLRELRGQDASRTTLLGHLQGLEIRLATVAAERARRNPRFGELHQPRLATIGELQGALSPDQALIVFQLADLNDARQQPYGAWVWRITRDGTSIHSLGNPRSLFTAVDVFLGLFERKDGSEVPLATRLYRQLFDPALQSLPPGISKLVIVPDEVLHRLPFDALREAAGAPPMAERFEISLAPSASTWLRWRTGGAAPGRSTALIFADPLLPGYAATGEAERAPDPVGTGLLPLPAARREARALARALGRGTRTYTGADATEPALKRGAIADYRVVHFATHAVIDDQHPERTAVLLAPGTDDGDDGLLQVREIVDLPLAGQLVMLSACRTVGGAVVAGEGPLGLAHGFFRAGARAVVATLWPVRDDEAADAFQLVGHELGRGASVAAAVASARRQLIARGAPAAVWAGLLVLGDGDLTPLPGGRRWVPPWWVVASAACALLSIGSWAARAAPRRAKRR